MVAGGATISFKRGSTAYGHVAINASYPEANTWKALAVEDSTMPSGDWYLTSHTVCVDNPAGVEVVKTSSAVGVHSNGVGVLASCPAGKKVLGFGAQVDMTSLDGSMALHQFNPTSSLGTVETWASGAGAAAGVGHRDHRLHVQTQERGLPNVLLAQPHSAQESA